MQFQKFKPECLIIFVRGYISHEVQLMRISYPKVVEPVCDDVLSELLQNHLTIQISVPFEIYANVLNMILQGKQPVKVLLVSAAS